MEEVSRKERRKTGLSPEKRAERDAGGCRFPVSVVSSDGKTAAAKVAWMLTRSIPGLALAEQGVVAGLYLKTAPGNSFSLCYEWQDGVCVLSIGRDLCGNRLDNAAKSIKAMLCRGEAWTDSRDGAHDVGWGDRRKPRVPRPRPARNYLRRYSFC